MKNQLMDFTEKLAELLSGGISVQDSLKILEKVYKKKKRLSLLCSSIYENLAQGRPLSISMKICPYLKFPDWYLAYICLAEECGRIELVLKEVEKILSRKKKLYEKCFDALIYPLLLIFLTAFAGFLSVYYFLPHFLSSFGGSLKAGENKIMEEAVQALYFGNIFLFISLFLILYFMRDFLLPGKCIQLFKNMAFLLDNSLPTLSAVSSSFSFGDGNKKILQVLNSIKKRLLEGEKVSQCFGQCLIQGGYKKEGLLLEENLILCEKTGNNRAFAKTAEILEEGRIKKERLFLSLLNPVLMLIVALYIGQILKSALLPYLTNFGGLI